MKIRFMSGNVNKLKEAQDILSTIGLEVVSVNTKINEIQTEDSIELVYDKVIKAFKQVGRPLFVEHTGLYVEHFEGLPGGLTQIFWDKLQADKFCEIFGNNHNVKAVAKTTIGYIDGKNTKIFEGEIEGEISTSPRGDRSFQWDCVFIPKGYDKTFAELGEKKNEISMRRKALDKFSLYLREGEDE
ncbi:non-canonical purine NTP pyrophosphatase [Pseudalkalibacillus berkeleyi]|uniref:Non-canonical purine NTP pyrophosphatase n=1 Tax=Pseudalkalibacillus berkeleyi TaxID=1069813 RepID=A0ABS9GXK2_9BACL|nr:non-canonical purine NTP pyrophosphatase [Pseudalkalibacillus berkeleyi]MCF6136466.1 non-canonical purine NTP pyrophosphatase [Pseudalkalibacillus berkeleyi]